MADAASACGSNEAGDPAANKRRKVSQKKQNQVLDLLTDVTKEQDVVEWIHEITGAIKQDGELLQLVRDVVKKHLKSKQQRKIARGVRDLNT
eukprot:6828251-Lingulodinium_polyedra.AAC.1